MLPMIRRRDRPDAHPISAYLLTAYLGTGFTLEASIWNSPHGDKGIRSFGPRAGVLGFALCMITENYTGPAIKNCLERMLFPTGILKLIIASGLVANAT
jgi:hypothetical protein